MIKALKSFFQKIPEDLAEWNLDSTIEESWVEPQGDEVFSILIPSWNNLEYLKLCIASIKKNSRYKHQIIVHANEGSDGTWEYLLS